MSLRTSLGVGERQLVELVERLGVEGADQAARQQRLHLVGADLDDVGLEAAGELRRRGLVRVEGRDLELDVGVGLPERVEHLVGDRVAVGEDAQRPRGGRLHVLRRRARRSISPIPPPQPAAASGGRTIASAIEVRLISTLLFILLGTP